MLSSRLTARQPRARDLKQSVRHEYRGPEEAERGRHWIIPVSLRLLTADDVERKNHVHDEGTEEEEEEEVVQALAADCNFKMLFMIDKAARKLASTFSSNVSEVFSRQT